MVTIKLEFLNVQFLFFVLYLNIVMGGSKSEHNHKPCLSVSPVLLIQNYQSQVLN